MKKIGYLISILALVVISIPILNINNDKISAATNYAAGKKVYVGNDTYTVIDSNTMTLLKNTATDAGEVTWNDAVASLDTLADNYGELGSKAVSGKFTLPTASDLTPVTNTDQTSLVNIDPISTDWWLGDASVYNRSKFVGANTNSLVADTPVIKNIVSPDKTTCSLNQTVIEQGKKPTAAEKDKDLTYNKPIIIAELRLNNNPITISYCLNDICNSGYHTNFSESISLQVNGTTPPSAQLINNFKPEYHIFYYLLTENGGDEYLNQCIGNGSKIGNTPMPAGSVCPNDSSLTFDQGIEIPGEVNKIFKWDLVEKLPGIAGYYGYVPVDKGSTTYIINKVEKSDETEPATCPGLDRPAGTSSVRPLLTLDKSKIAYSSNAKPSFDSNASLTNAVPVVDGNNAYLSLIDSDLGITLDSTNSNVSGNKLKAKREHPLVSIPVSLSGTTSGSRYVSAVAETNNGIRYNVLGQVNGSKGTVQLDLTSLKDFQTTNEFNVTLYQEVDEGTNTTYRGNGKEITIEIEAAPITDISFATNYPSGNSEWSEGDAGITTAGDIVGSFSFTGGTSGTVDPTSGKDYQKYEIVDSSGNPISNSNFRINNNELILKQKLTEGSYTFYVKVTDNANETFKKEIT
ncbi:hypothetical protein D5266_05255, partial [bacterium c-19]|nr:hypothetical protein [bacterium c-19]